jgi:hypothetical protein
MALDERGSAMPSQPVSLGWPSWERAMRAVELVRERLLRATGALDTAGIPYAVIGGNAVAYWVAQVDRAAVRSTPNVDLLLRRADLDQTREALGSAGLAEREAIDVPAFFDSPETNLRQAVQVFFAGEKVKSDYLLPAPELSESEQGEPFRVLNLPALVRMKLTSFRTIDAVHLGDMADVGLIDATWPARFLPELGARLKRILDTPNG